MISLSDVLQYCLRLKMFLGEKKMVTERALNPLAVSDIRCH